jgi:hypothetical protein
MRDSVGAAAGRWRLGMDHSRAPLLDGITDDHRRGRYGLTPPCHRQGRGSDPRVKAAMMAVAGGLLLGRDSHKSVAQVSFSPVFCRRSRRANMSRVMSVAAR